MFGVTIATGILSFYHSLILSFQKSEEEYAGQHSPIKCVAHHTVVTNILPPSGGLRRGSTTQ